MLAQERAGKRASPGAEAQQKGGSGWPPGSNKAATQTGSRTAGDRMGPCESREEPGEAAGPLGCWGSRRPRAGRGASPRGESQVKLTPPSKYGIMHPLTLFLKMQQKAAYSATLFPPPLSGKGFSASLLPTYVSTSSLVK